MPLQARIFTRIANPGSLVFSTVKRHKCHAPAPFLNQPWVATRESENRLASAPGNNHHKGREFTTTAHGNHEFLRS
jgi:hypothetical protein